MSLSLSVSFFFILSDDQADFVVVDRIGNEKSKSAFLLYIFYYGLRDIVVMARRVNGRNIFIDIFM